MKLHDEIMKLEKKYNMTFFEYKVLVHDNSTDHGTAVEVKQNFKGGFRKWVKLKMKGLRGK